MAGTRTINETEQYYRFVCTLYEGRSVMFIGLIAHLVAIGVAWWATIDQVYVAFMVCLVALWAFRASDMAKFDQECASASLGWDRIRQWEMRYILGTAAVCTALSGVAGYSLYTSDSGVAMVAGMAVLCSVIVSLVGRNFGTEANINVMTVAGGIPILTGGLMSGDVRMATLCIAITSMFTAAAKMARGIRSILGRSMDDQRDLQVAKDRFEAALANMPQGLAMLDDKGLVAVANDQAARLLGFGSAREIQGRGLEEIVRAASLQAGLPDERIATILDQLRRHLGGGQGVELVEISDSMFVEVSSRMRNDGVVIVFEDVTERVQQQRKAVRLSRYDTLSGLPNRAWMGELVEAAVLKAAPGSLVAFSVFDVDGFKQVNDTMGHSAGDEVIMSVGRRLAGLSDGRAITARLGGDEFVIAVPGLSPDEDVQSLMDRLYGEVAGFHEIAGRRLRIAVSGGVFVCPCMAFSLDEALTKADHALYVSKKTEGLKWTLFDAEMDRVLGERLALRRDFGEALQRGMIDVVYQPIMTVDGKPLAFEALARWSHPVRGMVPPSEFVAIAEADGLVGELTRQVLEAACFDCSGWPGDVGVSVNLSAADLAGHEIVDVIGAALGASGLAPSRLQVEVTETMLVADRGKSAEVLRRIREMGVKTALDDFGMGYSSLSYLGSLPLDKVKVDKCFIDDADSNPAARTQLQAIVSLVSAFGMEVVVEGVARVGQLEVIRDVGGVSAVQGYAFGTPVPPGMVGGYLAPLQASLATVLATRKA